MKFFKRLPLLLAAALASAQTPNWTKQNPTTLPIPAAFSAMTYDSARNQVVLLGGFVESNAVFYEYNATYVWDSTNWTKKTPASSPQPRDSQAMAFDSVRNQIVLFGGDNQNGFPYGDTWTWDGSTWTQLTTATAPSARFASSMAFDAAHGQMVLFGGYDGDQTIFGDTWVWDGKTWTKKTPLISPPARSDAMVTYDPVRGQIVMFGGLSTTAVLGDTWVWDGTTWSNKATKTSPSPRADGSMAFDVAHGQAILYGGVNQLQGYRDTWAWDGTNWTQQLPANMPTGEYGTAMAYDALHQQIVLCGGADAAKYYNETWTWPAAAVQPPPPPPYTGPTITNVISASAFGGFSAVGPGSWVEIYGTNLAPDSRSWAGADFKGNTAPTVLDGVQVSIGGQSASVAYISPTQINAQLPSTISATSPQPPSVTSLGPQQVTVTTGTVTSPPVSVTINTTEPGLLAPASFMVAGKQYVVALLPDNTTYILPPGTIAGINARQVHPGETIVLYGVGFGAVVPSIPAGQIVTGANQLGSNLQVMFGGVPAQVTYDGLAPGFVGLYQFNVVVPQVSNNDLTPITFTLGGVPGTQVLYTSVKQ